jgi:hypothetical protein
LSYFHFTSFLFNQIKLLQGAASSYTIGFDEKFQRWFEDCPTLEDKESFEISCLIEPHGPLTPLRGSTGTGTSSSGVMNNSGSHGHLVGSGRNKQA